MVFKLAAISSLLFLSALRLDAADFCIRPGGSGSQNGSDWNNAMANLPSPQVRGATYWIASGDYGSWTITTPVSGSTYIYFKKATVASHGPSAGWNNAFDNGPAQLAGVGNLLTLQTSYLDFDGQTGSRDSGHGFAFVGTGRGAYGICRTYNGYTADHLKFRRCKIAGPGSGGSSQLRLYYNQANNFVDHLFEYCYFFGGGQTWITESTGSDLVIDHCYFKDCGSGDSQWHSAGLALAGQSNAVIRYSVFENMLANGSTTYIEPQIVGNGIYVYGNVFRGTSPTEGCSQGIFAITAFDVISNCFIYNNTVYGLNSAQPGVWGGNVGGSTVTVINNVWQNCASAPNFTGVTESNNIKNTGEVSFSNAPSGDFTLASNTSNGTTLSSPFNVDPAGTTRVPGSWSKGAYQFGGSVGNPGTIVMKTNSIQVAETAGSAVVTATRLGGSFGLVSVNIATQNGTATSPGNYTASSGTLTWPDGVQGDLTFTVTIINAGTYGNPTFNVNLSGVTGGATLGSPSTTVVTINGSGSPPSNVLPWPAVWEAEAGTYAAPFILSGGSLVQNSTTSVADGGFVSFTFVLPSQKYVRTRGLVQATQLYQNSVGINFNSNPPLEPSQVCQFLPVTSGFEWRYFGWQGSGTAESLEFPVKVWLLNAGTNVLYIRGREALTYLDKIEVQEVALTTVTSLTSGVTNGFYKAGVVIPITVSFADSVTVTGTPRLTLNTGATVNYSSGSGSANLVFSYTVGSSQNATNLDTTGTSALALNGGTIKDSLGVDVNLTLPALGTAGALGTGRAVVIDTTKPTVSIGIPNVTVVKAETIDVAFPISYNDPYLDYARPSASDINVNTTGGVTATKTVTGVLNQWFVTLSSITVPSTGSLSISVGANTAADLAGNLASAAGPSSTVTVYTDQGRKITVIGTTKANIILQKP